MNTLPTKLLLVHDSVEAFKHLAQEAYHYLHTAPEQTPTPYARRLAIAAVAFTAQVAIEYGYDVETVRAMERDLIARLENEA